MVFSEMVLSQRAIWRKMNLDPYPYTIHKDQIWKVKKIKRSSRQYRNIFMNSQYLKILLKSAQSINYKVKDSCILWYTKTENIFVKRVKKQAI